MTDLENLSNNHIEQDMQLKKIKEEVLKKFVDYQKSMKYLAADAPIEILCLPKNIEKCLTDHGCFRVYEIFDLDLAKIENLSAPGLRNLTTSLNEFFSML